MSSVELFEIIESLTKKNWFCGKNSSRPIFKSHYVSLATITTTQEHYADSTNWYVDDRQCWLLSRLQFNHACEVSFQYRVWRKEWTPLKAAVWKLGAFNQDLWTLITVPYTYRNCYNYSFSTMVALISSNCFQTIQW